MRKDILTLAIIGMIGMVTSLVGIFISVTNDSLLLSLWSFIGFSLLACSVLLVDKKITEKEQKELYQSLTSAVEYRGNQAVTLAMKTRETDPIAFDMKLNYFIKQGLFEGKFDAVTKKVETAVTKNLEKQLEEAVRAKQNKTGQAATLESKTAKEAELAWKHRLK